MVVSWTVVIGLKAFCIPWCVWVMLSRAAVWWPVCWQRQRKRLGLWGCGGMTAWPSVCQALTGYPAAGQTPKMLSDLRTSWAPEAFVVSFKLETDSQLLSQKVRKFSCVW